MEYLHILHTMILKAFRYGQIAVNILCVSAIQFLLSLSFSSFEYLTLFYHRNLKIFQTDKVTGYPTFNIKITISTFKFIVKPNTLDSKSLLSLFKFERLHLLNASIHSIQKGDDFNKLGILCVYVIFDLSMSMKRIPRSSKVCTGMAVQLPFMVIKRVSTRPKLP